jgi:hypothetical protein
VFLLRTNDLSIWLHLVSRNVYTKLEKMLCVVVVRSVNKEVSGIVPVSPKKKKMPKFIVVQEF